jgi:hypothetical protein
MPRAAEPPKKVSIVLERRALCLRGRDGRHVDVADPVLLVPHVSLVLEDAQQRADGGVAGRNRHPRPHVGGRGPSRAVEDVHDLPLALAEMSWV